jgi:hypothetical protein
MATTLYLDGLGRKLEVIESNGLCETSRIKLVWETGFLYIKKQQLSALVLYFHLLWRKRQGSLKYHVYLGNRVR